MEPIRDKRHFDDIDLYDLRETQRQITIRINKIKNDDSDQVKNLKKELYDWSNGVLYKKAKYLYGEIEKLKMKIIKAKEILGDERQK